MEARLGRGARGLAAGIATAAALVLTTQRVNASDVQLSEFRKIVNCDPGQGPREREFKSVQSNGDYFTLGQLTVYSQGDGKYRSSVQPTVLDEGEQPDLSSPSNYTVYKMPGKKQLNYRYYDAVITLNFQPGQKEPNGNVPTEVLGKAVCVNE